MAVGPRSAWLMRLMAVFVAVAAVAMISNIMGCAGCGGSGPDRVHLVFTGVSKGNIVPYVCRFPPYKDLKVGGAAYTAALLAQVRAKYPNEPVLALSVGSELSGTPEAYFTQGKAVIEALNAYGLTAMLVGNIEFSFGRDQLAELSRQANFPFLSTNITEAGTQQSLPFVKREVVVAAGRQYSIAVIGLTPTRTPAMVMRDSVEGLDFRVPRTWIAAKVAELRAQGVQLIVLLSLSDEERMEADEWESIKEARPDVVTMLVFDQRPAGMPLRDGILVPKVGGYNQGKELYHVALDLDPATRKIATWSYEVLPIACASLTPDADTAAKINRAVAKIDQIKSARICDLASEAHKAYYDECPIGNLIADAMREYAKADVALQNSGGIQADLRGGVVTLGDLYNVLPFDNQVIAMDLTGEELREILTVSASMKRGVLQISGGAYRFVNWTADRFELRSIEIGGAPLEPGRRYRVSTNSFLVQGGDEFRPFKQGRNLEIGPSQREVVKTYLERLAASGTVTLATSSRIIRLTE